MLAIEKVWRERRETLHAIARSVAVPGVAPEDLLQEAITRALESKHDFEDPDAVMRFLSRVLVNVAIDNHRRRRMRRRVYADLRRSTPSAGSAHFLPPTLGGLRPLIGGELDLLRDSMLEEVQQALQTLPEPQREAVDVLFGDERPPNLQELCRERGIPYSTLRSRMLKAVDSIRARLRRKGLLEDQREVKSA